jgi:DNA-binding PadR family transcriptional regulator
MDLRHAILGLLSWKPLSGYDLKRFIADSDIFYWSGNNNQIYTGLLALQKEGLVTHRVEVQESLPAKKIYSITDEGLAELRRGLQAEPELPELRNGFLIQLAWAELLSDEEVLALLEKYEAEIEAQLRMRQGQALKPQVRPERSPRERFLWERIQANITGAYQSELDWVRQTLQEFRDRKDLSAPDDR